MAASYAMDLLYSLTNCVFCFPGSPHLRINGKTYKMLRLLGEGGFSYVYLVQEQSTSRLYALKKIRCPFGQESVAQALRECEAHALFAPHANIIPALDYQVVDARDAADPGSKVVYIILPYYRRGHLQDAINANLVNRTHFPERHLLRLFRGVAEALRAMHHYRVPARNGAAAAKRSRNIQHDAESADQDARRKARSSGMAADEDGEPDRPERTPLMESGLAQTQDGLAEGELRAYAHRDIKPGNIMIADDGTTPILMDLGSLAAAPIAMTSRALALATQDAAAEHSTMPYRAPELFDVKTGSLIDTKTDIWSFGCTLYACLVGRSPFEARSDETGGSLSLCVLGADWRWPDEGRGNTAAGGNFNAEPPRPTQAQARAANLGSSLNDTGMDEPLRISPAVKDIVQRCLTLEPADRPDVDELIGMLDKVIADLPDDEDGA